MRKEYNFSKSKKNPYLKKLKKPITIRVDVDTIGYFKGLSDQTGIPYQNLINLYLAECASKHKKIDLSWK
ncbi:BrnA antitoxin family protein [Leptospira sp. FAT2]|uniref:BrnA antitoxin family protein n=1 Tax=Leptospira sanjuanensis TaxID=2879643 RepID=UPI001EE7D32F|nr:BrnA antitoxin family protein [Leptospira sanjuanensis]MCG6192729.1 BrnA antitoxin family protein [Leptospira sanjuanensis]